MKGTGPRPQWPAPAAKTGTPAAATHARQSNPRASSQEPEPPLDPDNRITLSLLEEYSAERAQGYDPYNASATRKPPDVWKRKPKRD